MNLGKLGARGGFGTLGLLGGVGIPSWVPAGAIFFDDFFNQRAWPRPFASEMADTRASVQYVPNASGLLVAKAPGILSISDAYDLCEVTRTNKVLQSDTFDSGWTPSSASVVANSTVAPDGTTTADSLREDGSTNIHQLTESVTLTVGTNAFSFYIKPVARTWAFIDMFQTSGSVDHSAYFNLSGAGSVGTTAGLVSSSIQAVANGFYRCTVVGTLTNAAVVAVIGGATGDGTRSYAGTALATAFALWGSQGELGTSVSSYIPTTTVAAVRAANAITLQRTGVGRVVFKFDDDSTQTISGIDTGTQYTINPAAINRPLLKEWTGFAS